MDDMFNDRLARYSFMYRSRITMKEKNRFLKALVSDIAQVRKDIAVIEYDHKRKYHAQNVYVGNLQKASTVICTYYDTPPYSFGDYIMFNREQQKKRTTGAVLCATILWLLLGLAGTLLYIFVAQNTIQLYSWKTVFIVVGYIVYFYLLARISKGAIMRKTLIRNTSSILCMLELLSHSKNQNKVAYAFLDEGCYGEQGLKALRSSIKKSAQIYYLDCIGADGEIIAMGPGFKKEKLAAMKIDCVPGKDDINYLFCAQQNESKEYYLNKEVLKSKDLNIDNVKKAIEVLKVEGN